MAWVSQQTVSSTWVGQRPAVTATRFVLQSPDLTYWAVTMNTNGTVTLASSASGHLYTPQLQSPNGTIWMPSISNAGILSWTDNGTVATGLHLVDTDSVVWEWTISNAGIITMTSTAETTDWVSHGAASSTWVAQGVAG